MSQHDHNHDHSSGHSCQSHAHSGHNHSHDHHGHSHAPTVTDDSQKRVFWVMILTGTFLVVQVVGGFLANSLALIADSGHMLSDTVALGLAWIAFRLAKRQPDEKRSYGYSRFPILAAFTNGITLFLIAGWITAAALLRFWQPAEVLAGPMLIVAVCGLIINIIGFVILHQGDRENVNMRGALLHVLGDLLGSVGAIAAAVIIMYTGWRAADPLLAIFVSLLILRSAWDLVKRSGHILMEGVPENLDLDVIRQDLISNVPNVTDIHHLHAWALTGERPLITLHAVINEQNQSIRALKELHIRLRDKFSIDHATIQIECEGEICHGDSCTPSIASSQLEE